MKRKTSIIIVSALLVLTGAFAAWLIVDLYRSKNTEPNELESVTDTEGIKNIALKNSDTAFSFLTDEKNALPDDMRGYCIDLEKDIDISSGDEDAVKLSVNSLFDNVNAILPNTIVIYFDPNLNYTVGNTDYARYLIDFAHSKGYFVIFSVNSDCLVSDGFVVDTEVVSDTAASYSPDAVMLSGLFEKNNAENEKIGSVAASLKNILDEKSIYTGFSLSEKISETVKDAVNNSKADFFLVNINSSTETGAENLIKTWAETALGSKSKVYAVLRNDLVMTGNGWTNVSEISQQLRMIYNYGGFAGCVMADHSKLSSNYKDITISLYSYYEYFNNVEYTALDLTDFSIKDNSVVLISGTTDKNYPVFAYSTAEGNWKRISAQGDDGKFTAELDLVAGRNKISVKHKNAMYTYYIDKAVDVMTQYNADISDGKVTLSVSACKGAEVWASLANTVLVELKEVSSDGNSSVYSAEYELTDGLMYLTADLVSFAASYNGINDIVYCTEEKDITPYDEHGLGSAVMCVVTEDYAETTSTAAEDDTSDPTCTPQAAGSYGYVESYMVIDNHVIYVTDTGMKIYASDSRLILDGYKLPENHITLENVDTVGETTVTLSCDYPTFVKFNLDPQKYYKGFLGRIYNVDEFTAEYIDIIFMNTFGCSIREEPDFSNSDVISKAEWYTNSDKCFITLRLYLKEKGKFRGYSFELNEKGEFVISFRNNKRSLEGTVIMLDPGHGGYGSPGTEYNGDIYEKDITISIAEKSAEILREYGATVILTRTGDDALFLNERVAMIRNMKPDIYVSIHCDGSEDGSLGTHTFYYKSYSMPLAEAIHEQVVKAYRNYYYTDPNSDEYTNVDKKFKFFPYMVTRVEECPSVLVECGYLTNPKDAVFLVDENGRKIIATAIAQGIVDYLVNY